MESRPNRSRRFTAEKALARLRELDEVERGDEEDSIVDNDEVHRYPEANDSDSSSSDDELTDTASSLTNLQQFTTSFAPRRSVFSPSNSLTSRDGRKWLDLRSQSTEASGAGRTPAYNVFSAHPGPTACCRNIETPIDAWRLLIDEECIRHIIRCTEEFAQTSVPIWTVSESEMESFFGLLYLRGAMDQHNFPCDLLWSSEYGCKAFPATMSRDRFRDIKKHIRFDVLSTRRERLLSDKFALISYVFNRFVENSQKCYVPDWSVSVDEQLFPTKSRCKFTQYMSSKPDKFGIKFWILAEVDSKYCYNISPYLGKDESRVGSLGTSVVMDLMQPLLGKGYNVTCDNFFTNAELSEKLIEKRCSIVGTVRQYRREIPDIKDLQLHESKFYQDGKLNLTVYQAKKNKRFIYYPHFMLAYLAKQKANENQIL